jgi:Bacterial cell division membrane protein
MNSVSKIFRGDIYIWALFLFFCLISLVEVYSASSSLTFGTNYWSPVLKHAGFIIFGVIIALLCHAVKPRFFILLMLGLPLVWILLILTKAVGSTVNDAQRWMELGGVSFQPSELAKICLIATVAFFMSRHKEEREDKTFRNILIATVITCGLILLDNFSTAALLAVVVFFMLWIGPYSKKRLGLIALGGGGLLVILMIFLLTASPEMIKKLPRGNTWLKRIENFREKEDLNPDTYKIGDDNKQRAFCQIAISSGGFIGNLPGNTQESNNLHLAHTDFIYSIIIEEFGIIIGGAGLVLLYIILFIRAGKIANRCDKLFPKYLVMGSAIMIVFQAMVNMAVAVDLLPITGQNLPLVSRGGSSMLVTTAYIGIILSVSRYENASGIEADQQIEAEIEEQEVKSEEQNFWSPEVNEIND